ncbi:hypothetical protein OBE_13162, partial [human gut metagenome]
MTGQRRKQAQMGEHSRMNRTEFMRQLESLLQNISATEREEALQYYNEYFNDADRRMNRMLLRHWESDESS